MKTHLILIVFCLFGLQIVSAQSPWTREKGKAYVQLGVTSLVYDSFQFDGEKIDNVGDFTDFTIQVYSEYGITNKLEAQLIVPYKTASFDNGINKVDVSGIGNVSLGLKYKLSDEKWKLSAGVLFSIHSIKIDETAGLSTGMNAATILPYLSIGSSYHKWYYFGNVGYGYMNNEYSDYLKATVEVGYNIIPKGHLIFVLDARNPATKEDAFENDTTQWPSSLDRQTYNAIGLKANYEFVSDKFGANFSTFGAFGIDNSPLAPTINFGLYAKL